MSSFLDGTGLGHLIEKIKAAFIAKTDTTIATSIDIDSTPTADSTNLVTSGGVKSALDNKANSSDLSVVATTGSYTDLSDKPDIPTEIITGQIVGRMHRDNVSGTGNLTITGASGEGFSPNGITTAGKYIVVVYSWSETKTFGYSISFGGNNYTLSTTDGTISDKRELTVSAGALWSGSVTTAVSAGTTIIVEIYKAEKTTPALSVGTVALTNLYNDLDGKPTISSSTSSTSTTDIASSKAVKLAYDHGGVQSVNGQTGAVNLSIPADNTLVHRTGDEPVGGQKTFSSTIVANGGIDVGQGTVSSEDSQDFNYITTGGGDTLQDALDAKQPADFYIVNFTENDGTFTADKTFVQIIDAVEDNKVILGKWTYIEEGESFTTTYDSVFASDSDAYIKFTSVAGRETDLLIINPDNTVERIYYTLAEDDVYLTKQDTLVSGTNIKTIDGNDLLGSGDLTVFPSAGNAFGNIDDVTTVGVYKLKGANTTSGILIVESYLDSRTGTTTIIQTRLQEGTGHKPHYQYRTKAGSNNWSAWTEVIDLNSYAPKASPAFTGTPTAPTAASGTNTTQIATTAFVQTAINALPEPMIFKGSLGTGGTITTLPAASSDNEGFTYKVITAGTYASQAAKIGDTFISDGTNWILIPSGDEPSGTVTSVKIEATAPLTINDSSAITTSGTRTLGITMDSTPTANSSNPVTSGALKTALDAKANDSNVVHKGTASSSQAESIYGVKTFESELHAYGGIDVYQGEITSTASQDFSYITNNGGDTLQEALDANKIPIIDLTA